MIGLWLLAMVAGAAEPMLGVDGLPVREEVAWLSGLLAEAVPQVEGLTGKRFEGAVPTLRLTTRQDYLVSLTSRYQVALREALPEQDADERAAMAIGRAREEISGTIAAYNEKDREVVVLEDALVAAAGSLENARRAEPLVRAMLAHELVHALQDQVLGSTRPVDEDALRAWRAVREGHAAAVEDALILASGMKQAQRLSLVEGSLDSVLRAHPQQWGPVFTYTAGARWVKKVGGADPTGWWRVVGEPPESTASLLGALEGAPEPLPGVLVASEAADVAAVKSLGLPAWEGAVASLSGYDCVEVMQGVFADEPVARCSGVVAGRVAFAKPLDGPRQLLMLTFASEAQAQAYQAKQDQFAQRLVLSEPERVGREVVAVKNGAGSVLHIGGERPLSTYWLVRGRRVLELTCERDCEAKAVGQAVKVGLPKGG